MKRILAIDPGLSGGLAYLGASGVILDSMPATDQDVCILVTDRLAISDVCYIEKVGGYVGGKGAPGSSMFQFGRNVGFLHGLIAASRTRVIEVPPQTWQTRERPCRPHSRPPSRCSRHPRSPTCRSLGC